VTIEITK